MWNKYLMEGEFALLQSAGGDNGCVSSGPAFQTAGMKHAIELAAFLHCQRTLRPFSSRGEERGLVLSSWPSIFLSEGKHTGLNQKALFSVFFVMYFLITI